QLREFLNHSPSLVRPQVLLSFLRRREPELRGLVPPSRPRIQSLRSRRLLRSAVQSCVQSRSDTPEARLRKLEYRLIQRTDSRQLRPFHPPDKTAGIP